FLKRRRFPMIRRLLAMVVVFAVAVPALADDKVDFKKLKGGWERKADELTITFEFKDEKKLICLMKPKDADKPIEFTCDYSLKDGVLSGEIKSVEKNGINVDVPGEGTKFSFKIEAGEEKVIISDAKGDVHANDTVNGEYSKKK